MMLPTGADSLFKDTIEIIRNELKPMIDLGKPINISIHTISLQLANKVFKSLGSELMNEITHLLQSDHYRSIFTQFK